MAGKQKSARSKITVDAPELTSANYDAANGRWNSNFSLTLPSGHATGFGMTYTHERPTEYGDGELPPSVRVIPKDVADAFRTVEQFLEEDAARKIETENTEE